MGIALLGGLLVIAGAAAASLGDPSRSSAASVGRPSPTSSVVGAPGFDVLAGWLEHEPDEADGVLPDGVSAFDERRPGVVNLDAELLDALRRAATRAARDGIELFVESGWRSPAYQDLLLREAVAEYGSADEAARWVATAETSPHVAGDAADIAPYEAFQWLSQHGARYGLCQIYRNEPWHFELREESEKHGCPRMYADPSRDPRMQS